MPGATVMRIIPTRDMRLAGQHCQAGVAVEMPESEAQLALRHGWAVQAPAAAPAHEPAPRKPRASTPG